MFQPLHTHQQRNILMLMQNRKLVDFRDVHWKVVSKNFDSNFNSIQLKWVKLALSYSAINRVFEKNVLYHNLVVPCAFWMSVNGMLSSRYTYSPDGVGKIPTIFTRKKNMIFRNTLYQVRKSDERKRGWRKNEFWICWFDVIYSLESFTSDLNRRGED